MSITPRGLRILAILSFGGAFVCLSFVSTIISTPRERFLAGLSLLLIGFGFWLLTFRAFRFRAAAKFPISAIVLGVLGTIAVWLAFFGGCSIIPGRQ